MNEHSIFLLSWRKIFLAFRRVARGSGLKFWLPAGPQTQDSRLTLPGSSKTQDSLPSTGPRLKTQDSRYGLNMECASNLRERGTRGARARGPAVRGSRSVCPPCPPLASPARPLTVHDRHVCAICHSCLSRPRKPRPPRVRGPRRSIRSTHDGMTDDGGSTRVASSSDVASRRVGARCIV